MYFICGQENNSSRKYSLYEEREREIDRKEREIYLERESKSKKEREKEGLIRTDRRKG